MLTKEEGYAIDIARLCALCFIITCHVLQAYDSIWAFVFNIGVQMFLFISGFLYGRKDTLEIKDFFVGRLRKVYAPYLIYIAITIPILKWIMHVGVSWQQVLMYVFNLQAFGGAIEGLNHLWFLSILMIGYLLTPGLRWGWQKNKYILLSCVAVICILEYVMFQKMYMNFTWLLVYVSGLIIGMSRKRIMYFISVLSLIGFVVCSSFIGNVNYLLESANRHLYAWVHLFGGIAICSTLLIVCERWGGGATTLIRKINSLSYEIYLTHHAFCLGAMSLLFITPYVVGNILLMLLASITSAFLLHYIIRFVNTKNCQAK